ncbi:glycosyltransferase [Candidatus Woesearchaeota archaeon]|nr:glycosyltransferase [Candidatus Woesearchaeota archaeon]
MKILHCPRNIASNGWILSREQRKLGLISDVMVYLDHSITRGSDYSLHLERYSMKSIKYTMAFILTSIFLFKALFKYDLFHFHYSSFFPFQIDLPIIKLFNKKIIFLFSGCDVRLNCPHPICKKNYYKKLRLIRNAKKYGNAIVVYNPDLLDFVDTAVYFPYAIPLNSWKPSKTSKKSNDVIKILHAPSDRFIKGTEYVIKAINQLKQEGFNVELILLEKIPHDKVKSYYEDADIVVDQLIIGWYGAFAAESMALGKPVCCYIRDDLWKYAKGCPIINVNKENLAERLKTLIKSKSLRNKLGKEGMKYVKKMHDSKKINKMFVELYKGSI